MTFYVRMNRNKLGYFQKQDDEWMSITREDVEDEINSRIQRPTYTVIFGVTILLAACLGVILGVQTSNITLIWITILIGAVGIFPLYGLNKWENKRRTTTLNYWLDSEIKADFLKLHRCLLSLKNVNKIWHIDDAQHTWDWKRNAGVGSLVTRKSVQFQTGTPPFIQTNFKACGLRFENRGLFFFPDQILFFSGAAYFSVPYTSLSCETGSTRFVESETVPSDSIQIGQTWQYVRKDGGPDRRFSNNRQLPILRYGIVELKSGVDFNSELMLSNEDLAYQIQEQIQSYLVEHQELFAPKAKRKRLSTRGI